MIVAVVFCLLFLGLLLFILYFVYTFNQSDEIDLDGQGSPTPPLLSGGGGGNGAIHRPDFGPGHTSWPPGGATPIGPPPVPNGPGGATLPPGVTVSPGNGGSGGVVPPTPPSVLPFTVTTTTTTTTKRPIGEGATHKVYRHKVLMFTNVCS
ncbi:uncharacterized protein LOC144134515 [Amblyomma americanum]